jgi:hypothetical protein
MSSQQIASITITLPNGKPVTVSSVTPNTTVRELLIFASCPLEGVTMYNCGDRPMPDLDRTMTDYNNWYVEKGSLPPLYVKYQIDAEKEESA